jgi:two-component system cell cycle sensor histidine kinase PleC
LSIQSDVAGSGKNPRQEIKKENGSAKGPVGRKNNILAAAAHELRGPVSAIVLFTELLEDEGPAQLSANQQELVSSIRSSGELVLKLVEDLLDASAFRLGSAQLSLQRVDLASLMDECIRLNGPMADRKQLQLRLRGEGGARCLTIDRLKILRVINELLTNAIRASAPGGTIEIRLSTRPQFVEIAIEDEGSGISPAALKQLSTPFPKDARARKSGERGIGLGLAIAKGVVAAHKGRIHVKSQVGVGSTFVVSWPIETP